MSLRDTTPPPAAGAPVELVVLFGGQSAEHDVSCTTARHVIAAADPERYRITPVGISRDGRWYLATSVRQVLEREPSALPERLDPTGEPISPWEAITAGGNATVVLPLLHGPHGEDGTVQGMLELADVAYVGSGVLGSSLNMDKAVAKQVASAAGIAQARFRTLRDGTFDPATLADVYDELGPTVFVKPANMGSSVGVSKATDLAAMRAAIDVATAFDEWVIVEEAVVGREIEVAVLGSLTAHASVPGEIVPGADFYSYDDKYVDGVSRTLVPAPLSDAERDEVRALAERVFVAMRCEGLARVDFFLEQPGRGFLLNEVNTMPGFTPISMFPKLWVASGMAYPEIIDRLVELARQAYARRRR